MPRMVNLEGKQTPVTNLPPDCYYVRGVWYSSPDKLPAELKAEFGPLFEKQRESIKSTKEKWLKARKPKTEPKPVAPMPEPQSTNPVPLSDQPDGQADKAKQK